MVGIEGGTVLVYVGVPVATALLAGGTSYWIYRERWDVRGARAFVTMLLVGGLCWQPIVATGVVSSSSTVVRYATVGDRLFGWSAVMLFVVFASQYTASGFHRRRVVQALIGVVLGGFAALFLTSPWHGVVAIELRTGAGFTYGAIERGPVYLGLVAVGYTLVISAYYLILQYLLSAREETQIRVVLITLGTVIVAVLNLLSIAEMLPPAGFEYAAYGAFPFILCSTVAIFRLGLLDIAPVARRTLVETLTDPVIVINMDRRVADYNRAASDLWPALSTQGGERLAEVCPDLAERISVPKTEEPLTDAISLRDEDGTRHYSVLVTPVRKSGASGVVGYSILVRDVTEIEASRRALERQNEQLDRVAATVSHDLRNPLTVASGHTAILDSKLRERGATDLLSTVRSVDDAHERMDTIIDDVLTIAGKSQTPADIESVALDAVARDAWETVATGDATLEIDGTATVRTDPGRLRRILENLFRNSVEHSSTSSRPAADDGDEPSTGLTVRLTVLGDDPVRFAVSDDGPGIPPEIHDTLFEYGVTTSDGGTGIGLATVQTMARSLGWTVTHDPTAETGARFVFECDDGRAQ